MILTEVTKELFDYLVAFRRKVSQASAPNLDIVRHDLQLVFYRMEEKVAGHSKLQNEYKQVKYPLAVLADEIVLSSPWSHAKRWEQCLLEKKYFGTNIGGNRFFKLLSKIDRMPTNVVTIYFYCLALGFRGGFKKNDPSLHRLKGRLYQRIASSKRGDDKTVLPDAYHVDTEGAGRLPRVWKWRHLTVVSILVFLGLLSIQRFIVWPLIMDSSVQGLSNFDDEEKNKPNLPGSQPALDKKTSEASGYTVQLGTFSSEVLAIHFSQQLEQSGIKSRILLSSSTDNKQKYFVLAGAFASREEALQAQQQAEGASSIVSNMAIITLEEAAGDCIHGCD